MLRALVKSRLRTPALRPVVQIHDLRVHLQPIPHLVLGSEDRPVIWEGDIGEGVD